MKQRIQAIILSLALVVGFAGAITTPAGAINVFDKACKGGASKTEVCSAKKDSANKLAQTIIGILLWAVGIISVIMIVVGGIRFGISGGDAGQIKAARETIIYAVAGLVVALLAYAIVRFVLGYF